MVCLPTRILCQPLSVPRFLLDLAALQNIPKKLGTRFASLLVQFLAAGLRTAHQQLQQLVTKPLRQSGVLGQRPYQFKKLKAGVLGRDATGTGEARPCTSRFWDGIREVRCTLLANGKEGRCAECSTRHRRITSGLAVEACRLSASHEIR